jgi:hypothetical protein
MDQQEIPGYKVPGVEVTKGVAYGSGGRFHDFEGREGGDDGGGRIPFGGLDVGFYFGGVRAAVNVDVLHAGHGEEFEGVFN